MRLADLANIRTGCTLRQRPHPASQEVDRLRLLTISDVTPEGEIEARAPLFVELDERFERHMVQPGDVIFRGKSAGFSAAEIESLEWPTAVAAPLIVLQADRATLDPAYLAWVMNTPEVRVQMDERSRGSVVAFVGARDLAHIDIPVPPLETQRQIAAVAKLLREEAAAEGRLIQKRREYMDFVLLEAARKNPAPLKRDRASSPERVGARPGSSQPPGRKDNPHGDHYRKV